MGVPVIRDILPQFFIKVGGIIPVVVFARLVSVMRERVGVVLA